MSNVDDTSVAHCFDLLDDTTCDRKNPSIINIIYYVLYILYYEVDAAL